MKNLLLSFTKGTIWEIIGLILLFLLTNNLTASIVYILLRIMLFGPFELLWRMITNE